MKAPILIAVTLLLASASDLAARPPADGSSADAVLVDVDGNAYRTVDFGGQVWMAENLRTTRSARGRPLEWRAPNSGQADAGAYGRLYAWSAALEACPAGWRLPSDVDWARLDAYVGDDAFTARFDGRHAGYANDEGFDPRFGELGVYWSSTAAGDGLAWSRSQRTGSPTLHRATQHVPYGLSVRCLRER